MDESELRPDPTNPRIDLDTAAPAPLLDSALDHLATYAGMFITHWMEDDGNDAEDKGRCALAEDANEAAETALRAGLDAARAMLAALEKASRQIAFAQSQGIGSGSVETMATIATAIAQAQAAGIKAGE